MFRTIKNSSVIATWRVVVSLIGCFVAGAGCSVMIASRGIADLNTIAESGAPVDAVQRRLGEPRSSEIQTDGARVDIHLVRKQVASAWGTREEVRSLFAPGAHAQGLVLLSPFLLMFEGYATAKSVYDSERQQTLVAFVYGADSRLRYFYEVHASAEARFALASRQLAMTHRRQLEADACPTWTACVGVYLDERRRRAIEVGHMLAPQEAETYDRRRLEVAREKDEGRIGNAQAFLRLCTSVSELHDSLLRQLQGNRCPSWTACVTTYVHEFRRVSTSSPGELPAVEEELSRLLGIARERDEGRLAKEEALGRVGAILYWLRSSTGDAPS